MEMLNNIYGACGPCIAEAGMFLHLVCKITLDIKENAEVSFELWTKNPDQEQGGDLGAAVLFKTVLDRTVTCQDDSGYIVFYFCTVL